MSRGGGVEASDLAALEALARGDSKALAAALDKGADPNMDGVFKHSLLTDAIERGLFDCIQTLLSKGAHPNLSDPSGREPLSAAAAQMDTRTLLLLIDAGAAPGFEAMRTCWQAGWSEGLAILLDAGGDPDAQASGLNPLCQAASEMYGSARCVELLASKTQRAPTREEFSWAMDVLTRLEGLAGVDDIRSRRASLSAACEALWLRAEICDNDCQQKQKKHSL